MILLGIYLIGYAASIVVLLMDNKEGFTINETLIFAIAWPILLLILLSVAFIALVAVILQKFKL